MKSDAQLQQDVLAELHWEPSIDAAQIGVQVKNGVVSLSGVVATYAEKWELERIAQRVAGVLALAIEIEVMLPGVSQRSDADIARAAENVLQWMTFSPIHPIKVMVEDGWVTLSGHVDWEYQRQAAHGAIRHLMGVKGVSDEIVIKHDQISKKTPVAGKAGAAIKTAELTSDTVKADIEAALQRRARSDAKNIAIEVDGGVVTLRGTVHSWSERELARQSAWGTPGVMRVVDNLTLYPS